jgi:SAM-dependent methyltransferase
LRAVDFSDDGRFEIRNGVVVCGSCPAWYPIEDELLELLAGALAYRDDRRHFWDRHSGRLTALGLTRESTDLDQVRTAQQKHQQEHSDWYADNPLQTYSEYEHLPFWQAVDAVTLTGWKEYLAPQQLVLDVGCGQGRSTSKLGDLDIRVIGFDVSKILVRQAMRREDRAQWRARTTFFVGDASCLPFRDEDISMRCSSTGAPSPRGSAINSA